jgi:hypothetical protein
MKLSYSAALALTLQFLAVDALTLPWVPKTRPAIHVGPKTLKTRLPELSLPRYKVCTVKGGTKDDSKALLAAFHKCNYGGHVILEAGTTYTISTVMDLTFLEFVDWGMILLPLISYILLQLLTGARNPGNPNVL